MEKYYRYSATYKEGELEDLWEELYKEASEQFNSSSYRNLSTEKLRGLCPGLKLKRKQDKDNEEGRVSRSERSPAAQFSKNNETEVSISFPSEIYFSFLLIEDASSGGKKLVPVVLELSPIKRIVRNILKDRTEGGKR